MDHKPEECGLIVVVENDPFIRESLQVAIELDGYIVRTASNGEEAFALLKELKVPCLIIPE